MSNLNDAIASVARLIGQVVALTFLAALFAGIVLGAFIGLRFLAHLAFGG